ncbi:50S ribosomal protein L11 methyltransferase [Patescibacteria group bacterium]
MYFAVYIILAVFLGVLLIMIIPFGITFFTGAPFLPSLKGHVKTMLELAELRPEDRVVDLGSGSGTLMIAAAREGAERIDGFELNPILAWYSVLRIKSGVGRNKNMRVYKRNLFSAKLGQYDVIFVFGINTMMKKLERKIRQEARPGTRIISNTFSLPGMKPDKKVGNIIRYII